MKTALIAACLLCIVAGATVAQPAFEFGPAGPPWGGEPSDGKCQYGFWDDGVGWGWALGRGQQLGIECPDAEFIQKVGFYVEFILDDSELDIVIYDDEWEVSRTRIPAGSISPGVNEFWVDENEEPISTAYIVLCAVNDTNGYWSVLGEDFTTDSAYRSFYSNSCNYDYDFLASNLAMWVWAGGVTSTTELTWGRIRTMYR